MDSSRTINTQELLDGFNEVEMIQVIVQFEGNETTLELPSHMGDKQLFDLIRSSVVSSATSTAQELEPINDTEIRLYSVGTSGGIDPAPLRSESLRQVAANEGMLLAVRATNGGNAESGSGIIENNLSQSNASVSLLSGVGMRLKVDVTPSCSILLNGGIDYDLPTAIAELVDNSIAALPHTPPSTLQSPKRTCTGHDFGRLTAARSHRVAIDMIPSSWAPDGSARGPVLRIFDSGCGMDLNELRAWATLGEIAQDKKGSINTSANARQNGAAGGEKHLLGTLGRYGVGGKHAAFQLASSVTVSSRPAGAPFVYEATLDASVLVNEGDSGASSAGSSTYRGHSGGGKGGKGRGNNSSTSRSNGYNNSSSSASLLQSKQHQWTAELRVRGPTFEEASLTAQHTSWTCLELRNLKPGFVFLPQTEDCASSSSSCSTASEHFREWAGASLLRRSLANLFHFYAMVDPLPIFHTEGTCTNPVTGMHEAAPLPQRRRYLTSNAAMNTDKNEAGEDAGVETNININIDNNGNSGNGAGSPAPRKQEQPMMCLPSSVPCPGLIEITVNGTPITPQYGDFPAYWQHAATEFRQELRISPPGLAPAYATIYLLYYPFISEQETMPTAAASRAAVQPRKSNNSDRRRRGGRGADEDDLEGLSTGGGIADNTVHVFWMGRYLPRGLGGRDELLKWMKPRKEQTLAVPDRAWRRVRAFLFLGPQFEADRTKQALVPGAAYTRALLAQTDKGLQDRYCKWVASAHKKFDQELWFDEPIVCNPGSSANGIDSALSQQPNLSQCAPLPEAPHHDRRVVEYKALYVGGTKYTIGDHVEVRILRGKGAARAAVAAATTTADNTEILPATTGAAAGSKVLGTLQTLYQIVDSSSRDTYSMIDILPQSTSSESNDAARDLILADSYLASSLVRKVPPSEWDKRRKALLDNKPARLEWKECLLPSGSTNLNKGRCPPLAPVVAGSEANFYRIAIAIVSAEGKPLPKQTAGVTVSMVAKHQESGMEWTANVSMENSPDIMRLGQYVFSLLPPSSTEDLLPNTITSPLGAGHFTSAGTYLYRWRCVELPLPTKELTVTVLPAVPAQLQISCDSADQAKWASDIRERRKTQLNLEQQLKALSEGCGQDNGSGNNLLEGDEDHNDGTIGSEAQPVPGRVGVPLKGFFVSVNDAFGNSIAWTHPQEMNPAGLCNDSSTISPISPSTLTSSATTLSRCRSNYAGELVNVSVEVVEPKGSRLSVQTRWVKCEQNDSSNETWSYTLELTVEGMLNTTNKAPDAPSASSVGGNKQYNGGPWEERVRVRLHGMHKQEAHKTEGSTLEPIDLWLALTAGHPHKLGCVPDFSHPEPPTSLPNHSPLPPLRLVLLDHCGNRIHNPSDLRDFEVVFRFLSNPSRDTRGCVDNSFFSEEKAFVDTDAKKGSEVVLVRPLTSFQTSLIENSSVNARSVSNTAGLGWSDLGAVTVPAEWSVLKVSSDVLLLPRNAVTEACSRTATGGSGAATFIEAHLFIAAPPGVSSAAHIPQPLCTWQHAIAVSASSAPAFIDLGRPCLSVAHETHDSDARKHEAADSRAGATSRWNWLSTLRITKDDDILESNDGQDGAISTEVTEQLRQFEGSSVPLLAGCAGSTVQGLVVRICDEAGTTWQTPSSGWRLALYTCGTDNGDIGEDEQDVLAVMPLASRVPLEAVALPDWTLPSKVPSSGVLKFGLHLLRPPQNSGQCARRPSASGSRGEEHSSETPDIALAFKADIQVLPNVPFKLRLQPFADSVNDGQHDAASSTIASNDKSKAKDGKGSGSITKCGDEMMLACTVEDEYRNGISRAKWPHFEKAWTCLYERTVTVSANNQDTNDNTETSLYDNHSESGPQKWWLLPVVAQFAKGGYDSNLMTIDSVKPTLYLKSADEDSKDGMHTAAKGQAQQVRSRVKSEPRTMELAPQRVISTADGWNLEGVILGGRADGTLYKIILRDGANMLRASNVHVHFDPGIPDRVEVNGRVVWQDARSSWVPPRQVEAEGEGKMGADCTPSAWAFEAKNGARLPTLTVQAFDAWNNPALTAQCGGRSCSNGSMSNRDKRSKKGGRVGDQARESPRITVHLCPSTSASSRCKRMRTPHRQDDVEKEHEEEMIVLVPMMAVDELRGRTAKQNPSVNKDGSITAAFDNSGSAILHHIMVTRRISFQSDNAMLPMDGASYMLAVVINGLPDEILREQDVNLPAKGTVPRGVNAKLSSIQASDNHNRDNSCGAQLKVTWPFRLLPGRHPQRLEVATLDTNHNQPISSCDTASVNLALPTQQQQQEQGEPVKPVHWRILEPLNPERVKEFGAANVTSQALKTLTVAAGDCLPPMRLVVRAEDGKDLTAIRCRAAELRADLLAPMAMNSTEAAAAAAETVAVAKRGVFSSTPMRSMTASAVVAPASSESPASSLASSSIVSMVVRDIEPLTKAGSYEVRIFYTSRRSIQTQDCDESSQTALKGSSMVSSANKGNGGTAAASITAAALSLTPPGLTGAGDTAAVVLRVHVSAGQPSSLNLCRGQLVETSVVVRRAPILLERGLKLQLVDAYGNTCGGPCAGRAELSFRLLDKTGPEDHGHSMHANTSNPAGKSTVVQPLTNASDAVFYPHGQVMLSAPIDPATGIVTFPRITLHTSNESEDDSNSTGNNNEWVEGRYALRAVYMPVSIQEHSCIGAVEACTKSVRRLCDAPPCFEATVDLFPDASEHEAVALRKQRALVQKRAVLAAKAATLAEASRAVEAEYESRKQQLQRFDSDLESLRHETSRCLASAYRARILTGHRDTGTFELPTVISRSDKEVSNVSGSGEDTPPAEPVQVVLREAVLERCYALKAAHKAGKLRSARLGVGLKHDNELRKMAAALTDYFHADNSNSGGGISSCTSGDKNCLGLVGDSAWLGPHEPGLAVSIAAQVGSERLRAVILRRAEHRVAALAVLRGEVSSPEMESSNLPSLELNDPSAVAFCALDELDSPNEVQCAPDLKVKDSCRHGEDQAKVESRKPAKCVENGANAADQKGSSNEVDAELAAAAFEGCLDGEPLLDLPLPPLGLSTSELRTRFNWRGYAVNHLQFPRKSVLKSEKSTSLRRTLWLPLLGAASVFDTTEDALNCRAAWRAAGCPGVLGPLLCQDGGRVDEFGFVHGAPTILPGARFANQGDTGSNRRRSPTSGTRELWLGEPRLEACKEFRSMKALESALATESAQVGVRKDFYVEYYLKAKQDMKCQRQGSSKSSSEVVATVSGIDNNLKQVELLERQIVQLNQDIIALQPKPTLMTDSSDKTEHSEQESSPQLAQRRRTPDIIPFSDSAYNTKRPSLMDSCKQSQQLNKKSLTQARSPFRRITPGNEGSQKRSLKKFVSPVPTSQQSHADIDEASQKKKLHTRENFE